jgi:hypothetical protein
VNWDLKWQSPKEGKFLTAKDEKDKLGSEHRNNS